MKLLAALAILAATVPATAQKIALVTTGEFAPPAKYGFAQLTAAIQKSGAQVVDSPDAANFIIRLEQSSALGPQALTVHRADEHGKPSITLTGGDPTGLMYAALDTAERISWSTAAELFQFVRDTSEKPYITD